jgi:hypothetical protein
MVLSLGLGSYSTSFFRSALLLNFIKMFECEILTMVVQQLKENFSTECLNMNAWLHLRVERKSR